MAEIVRVVTTCVDSDKEKDLYFLELLRLDDWPTELRGLSPHFALFLACDASAVPDEAILMIARRTVEQGLAYLCAWGPECGRVHDLFDVACDERDPKPTDESVIITTWHSDDTLDEALWFFIHTAWPAADYEPNCQSWLAVAVGWPEWSSQILSRLADLQGLCTDVVGDDEDVGTDN
jgi:hypothetical protein